MKSIFLDNGDEIIRGFCGVCQKHFAVKLLWNWTKELRYKAREDFNWQVRHQNHESADRLPTSSKVINK